MGKAEQKAGRKLPPGSASSAAAAWHQREQAAMADRWPPSRIPGPPPKDPPRAPPNSLASTIWSREASTIGGRGSVSGLPWAPGALRDVLLPESAENEAAADGSSIGTSTHTALPLEDDWVPSYQRVKGGRATAVWPVASRAAATGRPDEGLPSPAPSGRVSGGHRNNKQLSGKRPRDAAATVISRPPSTPYANAMTTLAALSAGMAPSAVAADIQSDGRRQPAERQRRQQRQSRLQAFPPLGSFMHGAASDQPASDSSASSRLPADSLTGRQRFLDSIGSSTATPEDREWPERAWSSDTELQSPQRGWSSDTEDHLSLIKRSPNTPLRRAANGPRRTNTADSGDLLQRQAGLLMRDGSLRRRQNDSRYQQAEMMYYHNGDASMVLPTHLSKGASMPAADQRMPASRSTLVPLAVQAGRPVPKVSAARIADQQQQQDDHMQRELLKQVYQRREQQRQQPKPKPLIQQMAPAEVGATVSLVPLPRCLQPQPEGEGPPLGKTQETLLLIKTLSQEARGSVTDPLLVAMRDRVLPMRSVMYKLVPAKASAFLARAEGEITGCPGVCNLLQARTKWLDAAVARGIADGFRQVVVLAAGLSTAFWKHRTQGVKFYEVDTPASSALKRKLVAQLLPNPKQGLRPTFVGVDLGKTPLSAALASAGHALAEPTLFLAESLFFCLSPTSVSNLLVEISSISAAGSRLYFDFLHLNQFERWRNFDGEHAAAKLLAEHSATFKSGLDPGLDAMSALLAPAGMRPFQLSTPRDLAATHLPHLSWSVQPPSLPPFFGFAGAAKVFDVEDIVDPVWPAQKGLV